MSRPYMQVTKQKHYLKQRLKIAYTIIRLINHVYNQVQTKDPDLQANACPSDMCNSIYKLQFKVSVSDIASSSSYTLMELHMLMQCKGDLAKFSNSPLKLVSIGSSN